MASLRQAERFFGPENVIVPQLRLIPPGPRESEVPSAEGESDGLQRVVRERRGGDIAGVNGKAGRLLDDAELNAGWAPAGSADGQKAEFAVMHRERHRGEGADVDDRVN